MTFTDPQARWEQRFPQRAAISVDPRWPEPCRGPDCQTFAWFGYDGLCGWCHDAAAFAE